jgi:hypothetical protein
LPISRESICPASSSTREFAEYAVASPARAFSTPGPGTTIATPGVPVLRA